MTAAGELGLHLSHPLWLWAALAPLALWWLPWLRRSRSDSRRYARYADPELLPHLLRWGEGGVRRRRWLLLWTLAWMLGVLAMAGPRLGYSDVRLVRPGASLVVVLDISGSMLVDDVKPSRMARARQEVEDLLNRNPGLRIGLVAFASVAHVVAPITEDTETLRHLLPSLSPELVRWRGSRVANALERARRLLEGQPPDSARDILFISDGDFEESGLEEFAARLAAEGVRLHVLGVGSPEGAPVPAPDGGWLRDARGQPVVSRLQEESLGALTVAGGGVYRRAGFREDDTAAVVAAISARAQPDAQSRGTHRVWNERFYLPLLGLMVILALWVRQAGAPGERGDGS